jgi:hypothetical protein
MPVRKSPYSRKAESCVYPIRPGVIFKLKKPKFLRNPKLDDLRMPFDTFIWVLLVGPILRGKPPKCRKCTIVTINVPQTEGLKNKFIGPRSTRVRFKYITELLSKGYVVQGKAKWNYTPSAWKTFYTAIGINGGW